VVASFIKITGPFIIRILVIALQIAETPIPIIINLFGEEDFPIINKIDIRAINENTKVNTGIYNIDVVNELFLESIKIVKNTNAPTDPPLTTPNISGDAKSFLTTP